MASVDPIDAGKWKNETWDLLVSDSSKKALQSSVSAKTVEAVTSAAIDFFLKKLDEDLASGKSFDFSACGCVGKADFSDDIRADVSLRMRAAWAKGGPFDPSSTQASTSSWCLIQ